MGDHWLQRVRAHADKAGKKTVVREQYGLNGVCGVGGSSNAVRTKAKVLIGIEGLGDLSCEGSVLDNSDVPALL
eukprot:12891145-Prorocentrum_lima.AAC.1